MLKERLKKIENLELKLITLREERKKKKNKKTKSCTHNSIIKRGQNTKVGGNQGAFCFKLIPPFSKKVMND
jgi:hypothetical protein